MQTNRKTRSCNASELKPEHRKYFKERGTHPDFAIHMGARSVDGRRAAELLGRTHELPCEAIAFHYLEGATEYVRIRPDDPEAAGGRYLGPEGQSPPIFLLPNVDYVNDNSVVIVESAGKAIALAQEGLTMVGLAGVSTCVRKGGLDESWGRVGIAGKHATILFDANRATNPRVAMAEARLESALEQAGATVVIAELDTIAASPDYGPDDVLHKDGAPSLGNLLVEAEPYDLLARIERADRPGQLIGSLPFLARLADGRPGLVADVKDAFRRRRWGVRELESALRDFKKRLRAEAPSGSNDAEIALYGFVDGRICALSETEPRPLANCAVLVTRVVTVQGLSGERESLWELEAAPADGSDSVLRGTLTPAQMVRPGAFQAEFGPSLEIYSSATEFLTAVQHVSQGEYDEVLATTCTGWHQLADGRRAYVHAGGTIGATGITPKFTGGLELYSLSPGDDSGAVRASLLILDAAPPAVASVLFGMLALGPLASILDPRFVAYIFGPTGVRKSSLVSAVLAAFAGTKAAKAAVRAESTLAGLERAMASGRDVMRHVDDVRLNDDGEPSAIVYAARFVGDGVGRTKMLTGTDSAPVPTACGAFVICGEEPLSAEQSTYERTVSIPLSRGDVDLDVLTKLQEAASVLPAAMYAYVAWLHDRYDDLDCTLPKRAADERSAFHIEGAHGRLPDALSKLMVATWVYLRFCESRSVITIAERETLEERVRAGLLAAGQQHVRLGARRSPEDVVIDQLHEELSTERAIVLPLPYQSPEVSRDKEIVGYYDAEYLYLLPGAVNRAVREALRRGGQSLRASHREVMRRLIVRGDIIPGGEEDRGGLCRLTKRQHAKAPRVWKLPLTGELADAATSTKPRVPLALAKKHSETRR